MTSRLSVMWLAWAFGTTAAFALGTGVALAIGLVVGLVTHGPWGGAAGAAVVALAVAAAQYGVVRRDVGFLPWTLGSALAGGLGWLMGQCAVLPLRGHWTHERGFAVFLVIGAVIGAAVGVTQHLVFRDRTRLKGGWVLASALGWGAGLAIFSSSALSVPARMVGVVVPGVITATALVLSALSRERGLAR